MVNKIYFLILISSLVLLISSEKVHTQSTQLDLVGIIKTINKNLKYADEYKKINFAPIYRGFYESQRIIYENFKESSTLNNIKQLPNLTIPCYVQVFQWFTALNKNEYWAQAVIDSFGKPPAGILRGSLSWLGDYSECLNVTETNWNGKYCILTAGTQSYVPFESFALKYGLCMPDKCNNDDVAKLLNYLIEQIPENITSLIPFALGQFNSSNIECQEEVPFDTKAIIATVVISILVCFVLIGTLLDIYPLCKEYYHSNHSKINNLNEEVQMMTKTENENKEDFSGENTNKKKSTFSKILLSFSAYTNTVKLFKVAKNADQLDCLHAIRFLSLCWVILGHSYSFIYLLVDNPVVMANMQKRFSFMIVTNGLFSVDSFFLLSGLLTSYLFMKEFNKTKKITAGFMFKYFVHRLWRITPPYMLVLMINACLSRYFGNGPLYPKDGFELNQCEDTWWTNLLYINNIVKNNQICFGTSWYLANDMQFHFILAPIIMIPFVYGFKILSFIICVVMLLGNMLAIALTIVSYPGSETGMQFFDGNFAYKIYFSPWCRMGPYVVGVALGYLIYIQKTQRKINLKLGLNILFWIVSLVLLGLVVFGLHRDYNNDPLSKIEHILYQATCRIIWAVGLGYIIFACVSYGGILNNIFSWYIWTPLSRLSFSTFLIHFPVVYAYYVTQDHMFHIQDSNMVYLITSNIVFSNVFGYLVYLVFEVPLLGLEKFIFKRH